MNPTRLLCIHSLTAHGVVGLKAFLPVFGELCLPVSSALLSGPGDMAGCERFSYDFAGLLHSTLRAATTKRERVIVFIGYVASAEQISTIAAALDAHRDTIAAVCVDPVCGDDGRPYVASEIIAAWPRLIPLADWLFPNITEAELLTGEKGDSAVTALRRLGPRAGIVLTGCHADSDTEIETRLHTDAPCYTHRQPRIAGRFNGTGDLFAALFVRSVYFDLEAPPVAVARAAAGVALAAQVAQARGERDLSVRAGFASGTLPQ